MNVAYWFSVNGISPGAHKTLKCNMQPPFLRAQARVLRAPEHQVPIVVDRREWHGLCQLALPLRKDDAFPSCQLILRRFEPLFSTKTMGIGLGLALTKMKVEGHGGRISVESEVGKGTTISVWLIIEGRVSEYPGG